MNPSFHSAQGYVLPVFIEWVNDYEYASSLDKVKYKPIKEEDLNYNPARKRVNKILHRELAFLYKRYCLKKKDLLGFKVLPYPEDRNLRILYLVFSEPLTQERVDRLYRWLNQGFIKLKPLSENIDRFQLKEKKAGKVRFLNRSIGLRVWYTFRVKEIILPVEQELAVRAYREQERQ